MAQLVLTCNTLLCLLFLLVWWVGRWAWAVCLGHAFVGGYVWLLAPALAMWKFGWGFPDVLLVSLSLV